MGARLPSTPLRSAVTPLCIVRVPVPVHDLYAFTGTGTGTGTGTLTLTDRQSL